MMMIEIWVVVIICILFALFGYGIYYYIKVVGRPILACTDGPFKEYLNIHLSVLEKKYWPTFWCVESRIHTLVASVLRSQMIPNINFRREILTLPDGGEVALDWMDEGCADDSPCVLILPGLTGESQAEYVKALVKTAAKMGLRVVVFNYRGLGGHEVKTPRLYNAANCEDLSEVIKHVSKSVPKGKLGATAISMGGLILGNYLARKSEEARTYLTAAKIISVPFNVHKAMTNIGKPILNSLLDRYLAHGLYTTVKNSGLLEYQELDMENISKCKSIKEFDSIFTCQHFGYAHVNDYYTDATLHDKLHLFTVPTLCLSAADDPIQPLKGIPLKAASECSYVAIVVTARGGHIGFLEGLWPSTGKQYMCRLFAEYFSKALFDKQIELQDISQRLYEEYRLKSAADINDDPEINEIGLV